MTLGELDRLSEGLAERLKERGEGQGARIGILMDTSVDYAVALFGILKAGAAYVVLDTAQPAAALRRIIETAGIETVITNDRFGSELPADRPALALKLGDVREISPSEDMAADPVAVNLDAPAQIVFSSGTTGEPKGIVCPHRSAVSSYQWRYENLPYAEGEREAVNIFLVWEIMRPILAGKPAYLIPDDVICDPHQLVDYLEQNRISRMLFTPSLLGVLVNSGLLDRADRLQDLRLIYLNGEVVTAALLSRVKEVLPRARIVNDYSIAETHDVAHIDLSDIDPTTIQDAAPVGPPQGNVSVYVLDAAYQPVARDFTGEIFVGGDGVGLGYLDNPELTGERFLLDPFRRDGIMFRTGDVGRMRADGELEIFGRQAFTVKIRGYSVVPGSVEAALLRHGDVHSAVVVPEHDPETGQPDRLIAYVVLKSQEKGWQTALRTHLKSELPHYAMPSELVALDELPIAAGGKLDRSLLRKPAVSDVVETVSAPAAPDAVEPAVLAAWRELLGVESADPSDNFFDCGGHSLLAARLCMQLRESLRIKLRVVEIFMNPTFGALVELLNGRSGKKKSCRTCKVKSEACAAAQTEPPAKTAKRRRSAAMDVAVIGMDACFPGAQTIEALWENLTLGVNAVVPLSEEKLRDRGVPDELLKRPDYVRFGAHLDDVESFDPAFWGLSMREAIMMDPQHRLFLECCWKALESAGYAPGEYEGRTGVFAGSFLPLYLLHHLKGGGLVDPTDAPLASLTEFGNDKDYLATRVSYMLNLTGPSIAVQTSCSTGLVAIATAAQSLAADHCDVALAGAASIIFPQAGYQYVEGFINAPDGLCRAFDADACGTVLGDGVGVVVLKRLEDALEAGDPIRAVIKGCAINNDGQTKSSFSAPSVQGQTAVVRQAIESAAVDLEDIEYIETHGTGTKVGDPIEVRALADAFAGRKSSARSCALGSIKPNIGHANISAGVASFIKTVLSLQHGTIPATININRLNEDLGLEDSPFFVKEQLRPWPRRKGGLRTAGVTSLGIGGTNCHMVLQEWADDGDDAWAGSVACGSHALCLSAKTPTALGRACRDLASFLKCNRDIDLGSVAHTLRVARCTFDHRTVVVANNVNTAIRRLEEAADRSDFAPALPSPTLAFMLPGGGVQYPGMCKDLFEESPVYRNAFSICAEASRSVLTRDLETLVFGEGGFGTASFEEINVMMYAVQYSMATLLGACGVRPDYLVGHSMSEYVVATLAGILKVEDAIGLMVLRGRAMADLGVDGAMLAAKCGPDDADRILAEPEWRDQVDAGEISIGVVNSKTSIVLTGKREWLERLQHVLEQAEIPNQIIDTAGVPSHSPLMKPAADPIDAHVRTLDTGLPTLDIALNSGGHRHPAQQRLPETYWSRQATGPIRFDRALAAIVETGPAALVDLGPSRNLRRFACEAIDPDSDACAAPEIISAARDRNDAEFSDCHVLLECLGALWGLGANVDWTEVASQLEPAGIRHRIALPTYSFDRHRCWPDEQPAALPAPTVALTRREGEIFAYNQSWTESALPRATLHENTQEAQRWLLFADGNDQGQTALADTVARQLVKAGHDVVHVSRRSGLNGTPINIDGASVTIDPTREGLKALFDAEIASERPASRILCLWPVSGDVAPATFPSAMRPNLTKLYDDILDLTRVLAATPFRTQLDLWIASDRSVQIGDEPIDPEKACIFGPAIVLPQEHSMIKCRVVDLGPNDPEIGERLAAEVGHPTPPADVIIARRGRRRWVQHYPEVTLAESMVGQEMFRPDGVYLITGGLGRIGLSLTEYLVKLGVSVVVTTRRAVPARSEWTGKGVAESSWMSRLAALDGAPGQAIVRQVEMSDLEGVSNMLDDMVCEFGHIDGVFHAAGLADLKFLAEMDDDTSAREFASKVVGTRHLYAAIERIEADHGQAPDFVFLFSSLASILGGPAMAAYAAANRFMDAFARQVSGHLGVRWVNSNWDDWAYSYEGQVTAAYETSEARDLALSPEEGIDVIRRILATVDNGQVIVATRSLPPRIREWLDQTRTAADRHEQAATETAAKSQNASDKKTTKRNGEASHVFLEEIKSLLKVSNIHMTDNFFDLGGDSLMATSLQVRLNNSEHWRSPRIDEIFKSQTFGDLYAQISHA